MRTRQLPLVILLPTRRRPTLKLIRVIRRLTPLRLNLTPPTTPLRPAIRPLPRLMRNRTDRPVRRLPRRALLRTTARQRHHATSRKQQHNLKTHTSLLYAIHLANILTDNIKLDIHHATLHNTPKIRMIMSIRNNSHPKTITLTPHNRQTDTIHAHRPLLHRKITPPSHLHRHTIPKPVIPAPPNLTHTTTHPRAIHMTLHNMPIQPPVHNHTTLHINQIPNTQQPQITPPQSLLNRRNLILLTLNPHHRQAHPIMSHTLIHPQLTTKRTPQPQGHIRPLTTHTRHTSRILNNT